VMLFLAAVLIAVIGACAPQPAAASDYTVGAHLATAHFGGRQDLNDANPGVYIQARTGPLANASVGIYRNSERHTSVYAAYTWATADRMWAISAGGVTGYSTGRVVPLLVPSVRIPAGPVAVRLSYLAKAVKHGASGIHISMEADL
jgi:hypothetical protein